jgi:hypothetical protein
VTTGHDPGTATVARVQISLFCICCSAQDASSACCLIQPVSPWLSLVYSAHNDVCLSLCMSGSVSSASRVVLRVVPDTSQTFECDCNGQQRLIDAPLGHFEDLTAVGGRLIATRPSNLWSRSVERLVFSSRRSHRDKLRRRKCRLQAAISQPILQARQKAISPRGHNDIAAAADAGPFNTKFIGLDVHCDSAARARARTGASQDTLGLAHTYYASTLVHCVVFRRQEEQITVEWGDCCDVLAKVKVNRPTTCALRPPMCPHAGA